MCYGCKAITGPVSPIAGLDDLRDWTNNIQDTIPIYVAPRDLEVQCGDGNCRTRLLRVSGPDCLDPEVSAYMLVTLC
jgi:hypothetical protein